MNQANFFYIVGGNVPADALSYVTRDADALLLERLLQGEFCYILTTRQMGKSSLMTHMVKRLRENHVAPAVLDLSSQGFSLSAEQWYNGLLDQLGRRLKIADEIEDFCLEHPSLSPLQLWQQALRDVVLETLPGQVTIFIDEVDVVRSLPFSTDEFFAAIRSCYNARTEDPTFARLNFCLLGVATPADLISNPKLTPFNIGSRIELTDFSREEAHSLEHGLGQDAETNRLLMDRIYHWTAGHPYLTQRFCQEVAANDANLTDGSVDACAERLFLSSKAQRQDSNLTFVHQRMLPTDEEQRVGMLTLYKRLLSGKTVPDSDTAAFVSDLKLAGIVRAVKGQLRVRNRIYAHVFSAAWIEENMPGVELRRQKAAYRQGIFQAGSLAAVVLLMIGAMAFVVVSQARRADKYAKKEHLARIDFDNNAALSERRHLEAVSSAAKARMAASVAQTQSALAEKRRLAAVLSEKKAKAATSTAQTQSVLAEERRQDAERASYAVSMNLIQRDWDLNNIGHARELLAETRGSAFRGFEWGYWNRLCHSDVLPIKGHNGAVTCVAFSANGKHIVTGSNDGTAKVWDTATGREVLNLNLPAKRRLVKGITSVAFSMDDKRIVTGSDYDTARIWDATTGREILTLEGYTDQVTSVASSPDGKHIAIGSGNETTIWDSTTGHKLLTLKGIEHRVTSIAFSPDGRFIVAGDQDNRAKVWDAVTGREMLTLKSGIYRLGDTPVAFSPDGKRIVTGDYPAAAKVWDASTGREILTLEGHTDQVTSVAFSPNGKYIVAGSQDKTAKIWDSVSGQVLLTIKGHTDTVTSVAYSPDGKRIVTGSKDHTIRIWDATAKIWGAISGQEAVLFNGCVGCAVSVAFSPDGKYLASGSNPYIFERIEFEHIENVLGLSSAMANFDHEANTAYNTVKVWNIMTGHEKLLLKDREGKIASVAFSTDGKRIVTGSTDNTARVWDAVTGNEIKILKGMDAVTTVAFSADGKRIVTGCSSTAKIWDTATGRNSLTINASDSISSASFSPDGRRIIIGSFGHTTKVWDAISGHALLTLKGHSDSVLAVAFSPDGKRIGTGSYDNTAKVWDATTGRELLTLKGHTGHVKGIVFSADGKRIITGSYDNTAKVWDAITGRELLTLKGHGGHVTSVAFSPDGKSIATGSMDGTTRIWETSFN